MKTHKLIVVAIALMAVPTLAFAGGEKKGPNQDTASTDAKPAANAKALQDLQTADMLIVFGRREKSPEALLVAAQILHKTPTKKLDAASVSSQAKETKTAATHDNTPKALVAEAAKLSSAAHIVALVDATNKMIQEDTRGASAGPQVDSFVIQPGQTVNWNPITFRGGEGAEVYISNGSIGRMTLQVFDDAGNLVAQDSTPGNYFRCVWVPRWTGSFRIRLTNNDSSAFRCGMATN